MRDILREEIYHASAIENAYQEVDPLCTSDMRDYWLKLKNTDANDATTVRTFSGETETRAIPLTERLVMLPQGLCHIMHPTTTLITLGNIRLGMATAEDFNGMVSFDGAMLVRVESYIRQVTSEDARGNAEYKLEIFRLIFCIQ